MNKIIKPYLSYDVKITLHHKDNTETILTDELLDEYTMEQIKSCLHEREYGVLEHEEGR